MHNIQIRPDEQNDVHCAEDDKTSRPHAETGLAAHLIPAIFGQAPRLRDVITAVVG